MTPPISKWLRIKKGCLSTVIIRSSNFLLNSRSHYFKRVYLIFWRMKKWGIFFFMCYRLYISLVVVSFCRFIRGDNTELSKNVIVGSSYNTLHLKSCHSANHRGYIKMFQGYKLHLLLSFLSSSTLFGSSKGRFCTWTHSFSVPLRSK